MVNSITKLETITRARLTSSAQTNLSLWVAKRGEGALNCAVMSTIPLYTGTNADVTANPLRVCVSSYSTFTLWSTWNHMACGSTLTWPSITLCKHVSRSRVARSKLASFSLGVWISTRLQHLLTDPTLDRYRLTCGHLMSLSFSICSFFLSFSKDFLGRCVCLLKKRLLGPVLLSWWP